MINVIEKIRAYHIRPHDSLVIDDAIHEVISVTDDHSGIVVIHTAIGDFSYRWNERIGVVFPNCDRCKWDNIPHTNCLYYGEWRVGHSASHCTADSCY